MKNVKIKIGVVVAVVGIISGSVYFLLTKDNKKINAEKPISVVSKTVKEVMKSSQKGVDAILAGTVIPNSKSKIQLDATRGIVTELHVNEGETVTKGQNLFSYHSVDNETELKDAELSVANQVNAVAQKREAANLKWDEYNKKKANAKKEETKEEELNASYMDASNAEAEVASAQIEADKAQLLVDKAREKVSQNTVTAQFDGVIKSIDKDQMNKPPVEGSETPFMEIIDSSVQYVEGKVDEFNKDKFSIDQSVQILDRNDTSKLWTGKITKVGNLTTDDDSQKKDDENQNASKYPFKVMIDQSETPPSIGQHVYIKLVPKEPEAGKIALPKGYLMKTENKTFVWKTKNHKLEKTPVEVGEENKENGTVEIKSGLTETDSVVYPASELKEGMEVEQDAQPK
ncbi:efflux RND transporter periplasmic adaptor subunit [Enterococcus rotai]|uniref:efflux RND transporter periplasmic adaptor subunit n=1 Tax=Enterococcus rotai TaxID=118060 RepID=UPI0032B57888